jgi:RimJ/RimL family protein N-acetyltransferase
MVELEEIRDEDLDVLYACEADPVAALQAAFTSKNMPDREVFMARWERIKADPEARLKAIHYEGAVVGSVGSYEMEGNHEITYWIARGYWGKGIATAALKAYLAEFKTRPVHATAAGDNAGSIMVLEKCGFKVCGKAMAYANARGKEIEEIYFVLDK